MTHGFDKDYWESHWRTLEGRTASRLSPPNPYLERELTGLPLGTALDAGCGEGAEAIWLAQAGWTVTAADISAEVLARATDRGSEAGVADRVTWTEADLSTWEPGSRFDLVTTHYAHPTIPQLDFYRRLSDWVAPGGTLLIVGHLAHGQHDHGHGHGNDNDGPPEKASATASGITAILDRADWEIATAAEGVRTMGGRDGETKQLHDVVVRATRRSG